MNSWVCYILFSRNLFSEQSVFILMPIKIYTTKDYEIFMGTTRLKHISNASRITPISDLVREISLFQVKVSAQSGIWKQFRLYPVFE